MGVEEIGRFGISPETFRRYINEHAKRVKTKSKDRGDDDMVFYDWEAAAFARIFKTFAKDPEVCGVVCTTMDYVNDKNKISGR